MMGKKIYEEVHKFTDLSLLLPVKEKQRKIKNEEGKNSDYKDIKKVENEK